MMPLISVWVKESIDESGDFIYFENTANRLIHSVVQFKESTKP